MEKQIDKVSEQYWLNRFSGGVEGYTFPWEGTQRGQKVSLDFVLPETVSEDIRRICKNTDIALLSYFTAALTTTIFRFVGLQNIAFCARVRQNIVPLKFTIDPDESYQRTLERSNILLSESVERGAFDFPEFCKKLDIRHSQGAGSIVEKTIIEHGYTGANAVVSDNAKLHVCISNDETRLKISLTSFTSEDLESIAREFFESYIFVITRTRENLPQAVSLLPVLTDDQVKKVLGFSFGEIGNTTEKTFLRMFSEQVSKTPDRKALIHLDQQLTYRCLDETSGNIASALHHNGIKPGDIVAIMLNRSVDMITGLIGILKCGAIFLPVDPDYPAERINYILKNSEARCMITAADVVKNFDSSVACMFIDALTIANGTLDQYDAPPDSRAYVIYTSGTTGQPNGVMIEQKSLSNLCQWHVGYYSLQPKDITTKFAGFGFDASVWEIFPPLTAGSAIYIVEDALRLDVRSLNEGYKKTGVTISFLPTQFAEQFMDLRGSSLRALLVGGDKLRKVNPGLPYDVFNNYGPTENTVVSTVFKVTGKNNNIPIGRPINNSQAFILSPASGTLLPVGVIGELCFAGNGLASGYLKNPMLTTQKFIRNPLAENKRLYKTGDLARWLPDGNIEFCGRVDSQVKIRGYRIELEEIEQNMLKYPPVKDVVVVKKEESESRSYLCAYYTSETSITDAYLTEFMREVVPEYMIPALFIRLDNIPVNTHGKVDRRLLTLRAETFESKSGAGRMPENEIEETMSRIWMEVLSAKFIGTEDNFFALGGDSIMAIQIESRLLAAGYALPALSIFEFPTVRQLASKTRRQDSSSFQGTVTGIVPLTPIQSMFFRERGIVTKSHFNQALTINFDHRVESSVVTRMFEIINEHHDALRMTFDIHGDSITQHNKARSAVNVQVVNVDEEQHAQSVICNVCNDVQASISLERGPLMKLVVFQLPGKTSVSIIIHHLVIDGVSWRILFEDIDTLYKQITTHQTLQLPPKSDSFKVYSERLRDYAQRYELLAELPYWQQVESQRSAMVAVNREVKNTTGDIRAVDIELSENDTSKFLQEANNAYSTSGNHLLIAALIKVLHDAGVAKPLIWLEGHGRERVITNLDLSRTVGWFTTMFPFAPDVEDHTTIENVIVGVKDSFNRIANKGFGYGILKYLSGTMPPTAHPREITFNYLGQFDADTAGKSFTVSNDLMSGTTDNRNENLSDLDIIGMVSGGCLRLTFRFHPERLEFDTIQSLVNSYKKCLREILNHCITQAEPVRTASDFTYKQLSFGAVQRLCRDRVVSDIYPLSPAQEGMLFYNLLNKKSLSYNELVAYEVSQNIQESLLQKTLDIIVSRYDIFRTAFEYRELTRPVQVVLTSRPPDFQFIDLSGCDEQEQNRFVVNYKQQESMRGFDLENDTLLRLCVVKKNENIACFLWSFHHIIMDGWCAMIISKEFHKIYNDLEATGVTSLPEVKPYKNYIRWIESRDPVAAQKYWMDYLQDFDDGTPVCKMSSTGEEHYNLQQETLILDERMTEMLQHIAAQNQVTVSALFQGMWSVVLGRWTNASDLVFGKVVSGRSPEVEGIESMVGLFINTIPVRIKFQMDTSFTELVNGIHQTSLQSEPYQHQSLSEIQKDCFRSENIFDHIFAFENYPIKNLNLHNSSGALNFTWENVEVFEQTNYNFNIIVAPGKKTLVTFKYNTEILDPYQINSLKNGLFVVAQQICNNAHVKIGDIELVSSDDKNILLNVFNNYVPAPGDMTFVDLFEKVLHDHPHRRAIIFNDQQITYRELADRSDAVARALIRADVKPQEPVAILADRSIDLIIGLMGIVKSGAAFLPIDSVYPDDRVKNILQDSKARIVLASQHHCNRIPPEVKVVSIAPEAIVTNDDQPLPKIASSSLAYIIYTSGTTGDPNGVMISHKSLTNFCLWCNEYFQLTASDIFCQYASISFDASVWEIFPTMTRGACLYVAADSERYDIKQLHEKFSRQGITFSFLPPQLAEQFMEMNHPQLKKLLIAGDKLKKINEAATYEIYNNYGPTENTILSIVGHIKHNARNIPLGRPINTTRVYIVSPASDKLQPIGFPGEIRVSGDGVALGYLGKPDLTNKKFADDPFVPGERMYRTGDLARWLPDGNVEFLGRIDRQVKVRGYRIELGEIEHALITHPDIDEASVVVRQNNNGYAILYGFYTGEMLLPVESIKSFLSKSLPFYMVPSYFIKLNHLPVNHSGKVDKNALEKECGLHSLHAMPVPSPVNSTQSSVLNVWREILGVENIGVSDNFFDLGGTSLDMIKVSEKLTADFNVNNLLMQMFKYPTVNLLAKYLDDNGKASEIENQEQPADTAREAAIISRVRVNQREKRKSR